MAVQFVALVLDTTRRGSINVPARTQVFVSLGVGGFDSIHDAIEKVKEHHRDQYAGVWEFCTYTAAEGHSAIIEARHPGEAQATCKGLYKVLQIVA